MTAIVAILVDSYRELIAKKLFWFVLAISLLLVLSYGSIGFNDRGISIGYGLHTFESQALRSGSIYVRPFMDTIFSSFIVQIWLAWGAVILALVSTAEIFPNFLAGGSIDLVLSKPIRRATVFFTKYVGSLLFVILQAAIFSIGILLVIQFRLGEWRWAVLLAIPLVVLVFSYLFCIMVLFNVMTRSTITSLILTMLTWVGIFTLHTTTGLIEMFMVVQPEIRQDALVDRVKWYDDQIVKATEANDPDRAQLLIVDRDREQTQIEELDLKLDRGRQIYLAAKTMVYLLPKTSETTNLLTRRLAKETGWTPNDLMNAVAGNAPKGRRRDVPPPVYGDLNDERLQQESTRRMEHKEMTLSPFYIVGTSLIFESALLGLAVLIFSRREA